MNFSFELQGAALTGSVNPETMMGMNAVMGALFGGLAMIRMILLGAIIVLMVISRWKVFTKAGLPGWGIFIPFYNRYLMFKLGGRSGRNFLWIIFPPVFVILMIINYFKIAKAFGKPWPYGLGLRFVKVIFIPILAFDNSTYLGKKSVTKTATPLTRTVSKAPAKKVVVKKIIKKAPAKKAPVKKVKTLITKK